jgi:membrane-bound ClpP family serine protease
MSLIKSLDSKLMRLLTCNLRYPDWSQAPLSFARNVALIYLLLAALYFLMPMFFSRKADIWEWILGAFWLSLAFYHFRLWRRLKAERIK